MIDKIALELVELVEKAISGEMSAIEAHNIFWDRFWDNNEWQNHRSENVGELLSNDIFYAFEEFVVVSGLAPEDISDLIDRSEDSHDLDEEQFLQKCREFLPKLKELASK